MYWFLLFTLQTWENSIKLYNKDAQAWESSKKEEGEVMGLVRIHPYSELKFSEWNTEP